MNASTYVRIHWVATHVHAGMASHYMKTDMTARNVSFTLKDLGTFSKCQQIYIKLTGFEDNDSGKLPFKYY